MKGREVPGRFQTSLDGTKEHRQDAYATLFSGLSSNLWSDPANIPRYTLGLGFLATSGHRFAQKRGKIENDNEHDLGGGGGLLTDTDNLPGTDTSSGPNREVFPTGGSPFQEPGDQKNTEDLRGYQNPGKRFMTLSRVDHADQQQR